MISLKGAPDGNWDPNSDGKTALAWHMYFTDPRDLRRANPSNGLIGELPMKSAFAEIASSARPGIRSGLAVLLGADYENQALKCAHVCDGDLNTLHSLLTQAGVDLTERDSYTVERLFAAATTDHGNIACSLLPHKRAQKSDFHAMHDEDLRWRSSTRSRTAPLAAARVALTPRKALPGTSSALCGHGTGCVASQDGTAKWPHWHLRTKG